MGKPGMASPPGKGRKWGVLDLDMDLLYAGGPALLALGLSMVLLGDPGSAAYYGGMAVSYFASFLTMQQRHPPLRFARAAGALAGFVALRNVAVRFAWRWSAETTRQARARAPGRLRF